MIIQAPLTPALEVLQGPPEAPQGALEPVTTRWGLGPQIEILYAGQKVPGPGICSSNLT